MTERTEQFSTTEKFAANAIILLIVIGIIGGIGYGLNAFHERTMERERIAKTDCVARGGKVTEYSGGFTQWACVGLERIK